MSGCVCAGAGWLRRDVPTSDPEFGKLIRCICNPAQAAADVNASAQPGPKSVPVRRWWGAA